MPQNSDWVGVALVSLLAAVLYGVSALALWALGPAFAMTLLAAALFLEGRSQPDKQEASGSTSG